MRGFAWGLLLICAASGAAAQGIVPPTTGTVGTAGCNPLGSAGQVLSDDGNGNCTSHSTFTDDGTTVTVGEALKVGGRLVVPYNIATPTTGSTVTMGTALIDQIIKPAGTLATLTVQLPGSPVDGEKVGISTTQILTALTISAPGGATVVTGQATPFTLSAGGSLRLTYNASGTTWYVSP